MKKTRKKYTVDVFRNYWGGSGEHIREKIDTCETWAVSEAQAKNNVRFRTIGKDVPYWEGYDDSCVTFSYEIRREKWN